MKIFSLNQLLRPLPLAVFLFASACGLQPQHSLLTPKQIVGALAISWITSLLVTLVGMWQIRREPRLRTPLHFGLLTIWALPLIILSGLILIGGYIASSA